MRNYLVWLGVLIVGLVVTKLIGDVVPQLYATPMETSAISWAFPQQMLVTVLSLYCHCRCVCVHVCVCACGDEYKYANGGGTHISGNIRGCF